MRPFGSLINIPIHNEVHIFISLNVPSEFINRDTFQSENPEKLIGDIVMWHHH